MKIKIITLFALLISNLSFAGLLKLKFRAPNLEVFTIEIDDKSTVYELKKKIFERTKIPIRNQNLKGVIINMYDNWLLSDYIDYGLNDKIINVSDTSNRLSRIMTYETQRGSH